MAKHAPFPTEFQEQVALINWCNAHTDRRLKLIYAHVNGARMSIGAAVKLKQSGAKKGIPDLFLPVACGGYYGLYVELKRVKGGVLSPEQKRWIALLNEQGYLATVCKGVDEAIDVISSYLKASEL